MCTDSYAWSIFSSPRSTKSSFSASPNLRYLCVLSFSDSNLMNNTRTYDKVITSPLPPPLAVRCNWRQDETADDLPVWTRCEWVVVGRICRLRENCRLGQGRRTLLYIPAVIKVGVVSRWIVSCDSHVIPCVSRCTPGLESLETTLEST